MALGTSAMEDKTGGGAAAVLSSEPVAAISDPPAHDGDGDGCDQGPQERECEVRDQSKKNEDNPENLLFHDFIVCFGFSFLA
jgi:hypothetical protein